MRSPREIAFRLRQEAANAWLCWTRPRVALPPPAAPLAGLPDPEPVAAQLADSSFARQVTGIADSVCAHRFPLFDAFWETGPEIDWRRDYRHGISTPVAYLRRIPYLDFHRAGDHKFIWELNRHQHLVALAQAWLLTGQSHYLAELSRQVESWVAANPFQRSINWTSALEVAVRALSWIWVYHLAGKGLDEATRWRLWNGLHQSGLHLEYNLSFYFSPNTHLLGESVALHAIGTLFPRLPRAERWRRLGRRVTLEQMEVQVAGDGSHFEQSTYYHVYAMDFFVLHHLLESAPDFYLAKLRRMAGFLDAVLGPARMLACLGDDDGGRLFHPYGPRERFGRATLATCAQLFPEAGWSFHPEDLAEQALWWVPCAGALPRPAVSAPRTSRLFPDSGLAAMVSGDLHLLADAGPFGFSGGGHSHSDTLSVVVRRSEEEILIDPGTYTYISDINWRNRFRGSGSHNTIRVDGMDQAEAAGPFRWLHKPKVELRAWESTPAADYLDARWEAWNGLAHRRRLLFLKSEELLLVVDEVEGEGEHEHEVEQFWHLGREAARQRFAFAGMPGRIELVEGWRSKTFGSKVPSPVLVRSGRARLPVRLATVLDLAASPSRQALDLAGEGKTLLLPKLRVEFLEDKPPRIEARV